MLETLYLLNIGNTHTHSAIYSGGELVEVKKWTSYQKAYDATPKGACIIISSVVKNLKQVLIDPHIFWIDYTKINSLDLSLVSKESIGIDRLANCAALYAHYPLPAIVIDIGTAITVEIVDERGVLLPLFIAPGRALMRKSLFDFTSQLPLVEMEYEGEASYGHTTENAIALGSDIGLQGMIREFLTYSLQFVDKEFKSIVFTGGDAKSAGELSPFSYTIDYDLTFKGMVAIWKNQKEI